MRGVTNYLTLMDQLRRASSVCGPIILVTFNYDRLLDQALHHFDVNIKSIDDYIINDKVKLFKLHGSINWEREIDSLEMENIEHTNPNEIAHYIIDQSPNLKISNNYVFEDSQSPFVRKNGLPVYPALAIPIETKQNFECPDDHIDKLRQVIKSAERVLIVGWRAAETHFIDIIKANVTRELTIEAVCGRKDWSADTLTRIESHGIKIIGKPFDGGFTEYVRSREAERFFS
jgi:SIR2-like domain